MRYHAKVQEKAFIAHRTHASAVARRDGVFWQESHRATCCMQLLCGLRNYLGLSSTLTRLWLVTWHSETRDWGVRNRRGCSCYERLRADRPGFGDKVSRNRRGEPVLCRSRDPLDQPEG